MCAGLSERTCNPSPKRTINEEDDFRRVLDDSGCLMEVPGPKLVTDGLCNVLLGAVIVFGQFCDLLACLEPRSNNLSPNRPRDKRSAVLHAGVDTYNLRFAWLWRTIVDADEGIKGNCDVMLEIDPFEVSFEHLTDGKLSHGRSVNQQSTTLEEDAVNAYPQIWVAERTFDLKLAREVSHDLPYLGEREFLLSSEPSQDVCFN